MDHLGLILFFGGLIIMAAGAFSPARIPDRKKWRIMFIGSLISLSSHIFFWLMKTH